MNATPYRAAPCCRCLAPARAFRTEQEARAYAAEACRTFRVCYKVYCTRGVLRLVSRHEPARTA
jgi:hypothetical protein